MVNMESFNWIQYLSNYPDLQKAGLTTKEGPYTYDEILAILATPEWTDPNPMGGI